MFNEFFHHRKIGKNFSSFSDQKLNSKLCGLDLPKYKVERQRHYQNRHGVTVDEASRIASCSTRLAEWRKLNGFTDIPGQCGYCFKIMQGYRVFASLTQHIRACKAKTLANISNAESNSSSALEEVINDSGPVLDSLLETQEIVELRAQIQKLIRQNEQLKDSKANRLLAKSKSRQAKLETKVKMLKTENKKLLEKYIKLLESLLPK